MISQGRECFKMPCESCAIQFSVFRRRRVCSECERFYCSGCLRRGGGTMCAACRLLSTRPLSRSNIAHLKVRDLQSFLQRQNVSTRGCVEKEELVSLCITHVNSTAYRRRGQRTGPFSSLKGFTNNINEFINSAFDIRHTPPPVPPRSNYNCFNSSHFHTNQAQAPPAERFTTTPGGEANIEVPVPVNELSSGSSDGPRVDSADCYEVEDLDDSGWEFVTTPAEPLPNDSEVLMAPPRVPPPPAGWNPPSPSPPPVPPPPAAELLTPRVPHTPQRAASALELRREATPGADTESDSASLQDEQLHTQLATERSDDSPQHITLENLKSADDVENLSVKQLKELLARNRVEYRGCVERSDLLDRARILWRDHAKYRDEVDKLPIEECCKICMAAPLECVLLECGHIAACTACGKQLAECPICRQYVVRIVRCFRS